MGFILIPLREHRTDALLEAATVGIIASDTARFEAHGVCKERVFLEERTRPVEASFAYEGKALVVVPEARSRQEKRLAVAFARDEPAAYAVQRCPSRRRIVAAYQFLELRHGRHLPVPAPVRSCSIVFRQQLREGICKAVVTVAA